jgi:hypothetical protein
MSYSRKVHVVRIENQKRDDQLGQKEWVIVKVLDQVAIRAPNGKEILYDVTAKNSQPYIRDDTGGGNGRGDPHNCTRSSHMTRLTDNQAPPNAPSGTQAIDTEVLDAFCVRGPNSQETLFEFPSKGATVAVTDNTGSGLAVPFSEQTTRALHVAKINATGYTVNPGTSGEQTRLTGSVNSDAPDVAPPAGSQVLDDKFMVVERVDALAFRGKNGQEYLLLIADKNATEHDTTQYEAGGKPPLNADPDVYVSVPDEGTPWIGKAPRGGDGRGINQGPLWWITGVGYEPPTVLPPPPPGFYNVTYSLQTAGPVDGGHVALEAAWLGLNPRLLLPRIDGAFTNGFTVSIGPVPLDGEVRLGIHPPSLFDLVSGTVYSLGQEVTVPNPNFADPPQNATVPVDAILTITWVGNLPPGDPGGPGLVTSVQSAYGVSGFLAVTQFYQFFDEAGSPPGPFDPDWIRQGQYGCSAASDNLFNF